MSAELGILYIITGPDTTEARLGGDNTHANYIGPVLDSSGWDSPELRETVDELVEGDGSVHGPSFFGRCVRQLDGMIAVDHPTTTLRQRIERLQRATRALRQDGTVLWTPSDAGSVQRMITFRRSGRTPIITGRRPRNFTITLSSERIPEFSAAELTNGSKTSGSSPSVGGNAETFPRFEITPSSDTITIKRTVPTLGGVQLEMKLSQAGINGSGTIYIDFWDRRVWQGNADPALATDRRGAIVWPTSYWWPLTVGSNTWTITGGTAQIFYRTAWSG